MMKLLRPFDYFDDEMIETDDNRDHNITMIVNAETESSFLRVLRKTQLTNLIMQRHAATDPSAHVRGATIIATQ